jgi:hypothetical protein
VPTLDPDYQVRRIQEAERALERGLRDLEGIQNSVRRYTPEAEEEERQRIHGVYADEATTVEEVFREYIVQAQTERDHLEAQLANPRLGWAPEQVQATNAHQVAVDRDLRLYAFGELAAQLRAALASGNAPLQLAWRDGLLGLQAERQRDGAMPAAAVAEVATWAAAFSAKLREGDPALVQRIKDAEKRIGRYEDGQRRVWDLLHPRRVAQNQASLVASGQYDRL